MTRPSTQITEHIRLRTVDELIAAHEADLAEFRRTLAWLAVAVATIFGLGIAFALPLIAALTA